LSRQASTSPDESSCQIVRFPLFSRTFGVTDFLMWQRQSATDEGWLMGTPPCQFQCDNTASGRRGVGWSQTGSRLVYGNGTNHIGRVVRQVLASVDCVHRGVQFAHHSPVDGLPVNMPQSWCLVIVRMSPCCIVLKRHDSWLWQIGRSGVAVFEPCWNEQWTSWPTGQRIRRSQRSELKHDVVTCAMC